MKTLRPGALWPRATVAALLALAAIIAISAVLVAAHPAAAPSASATAPGAGAETSPTIDPSLIGFDCSTTAQAPNPTPDATAVPSPLEPGSAPRGWPVKLTNMEREGRLAPDGTSYFIESGYLVAVDASGREQTGWPQPLGIPTDLNTPMAFGSDGVVYVWSDSTVDAFRADGTKPAGWPYHTAAVEDVLPVPQGVFVESAPSGWAGCRNESHLMTLIAAAGVAQPSWRVQGDIAAVGPDGTIYTSQGDSVFAYRSDGAVMSGWPATGWSRVSIDLSGRVYLSSWKFRPITGISAEGPGLALETRIAAVDQTGHPTAGWPVTIEGGASEPAFSPDGAVYLTTEIYASGSLTPTETVLALDAYGKPQPGWPIRLPTGSYLLASLPSISAPAPDPPQVGPDGTIYFGADTADPNNPGTIEEVDPFGRVRPGFPASVDWSTTSNMFSGPGSGWFAVGRTGLVFEIDNYSILAIGPNGKNASGWPVKAPAHAIIMAAAPEPDGGLLVQLLNSSLVIAPGASVGHGSAQRLGDPLAALAPDFPGTLTVIRYLPDGRVAG